MAFTVRALGCFCLVCMYVCVSAFLLKSERGAVYLSIQFSHISVHFCLSICRIGLDATQSDLAGESK